jgi:hypothetical protein
MFCPHRALQQLLLDVESLIDEIGKMPPGSARRYALGNPSSEVKGIALLTR